MAALARKFLFSVVSSKKTTELAWLSDVQVFPHHLALRYSEHQKVLNIFLFFHQLAVVYSFFLSMTYLSPLEI